VKAFYDLIQLHEGGAKQLGFHGFIMSGLVVVARELHTVSPPSDFGLLDKKSTTITQHWITSLNRHRRHFQNDFRGLSVVVVILR
jgi:hypothetical protein